MVVTDIILFRLHGILYAAVCQVTRTEHYVIAKVQFWRITAGIKTMIGEKTYRHSFAANQAVPHQAVA